MLDKEQKEKLLTCAVTWNCNSRNTDVSQRVLKVILEEISSGQLDTPGLSEHIENISPYTERHFKRLTNMLQDVYLLKYSLNKMKPC